MQGAHDRELAAQLRQQLRLDEDQRESDPGPADEHLVPGEERDDQEDQSEHRDDQEPVQAVDHEAALLGEVPRAVAALQHGLVECVAVGDPLAEPEEGPRQRGGLHDDLDGDQQRDDPVGLPHRPVLSLVSAGADSSGRRTSSTQVVTSHSQKGMYNTSHATSFFQTNCASDTAIPPTTPHQPSQRGMALVVTMTQPQARAKLPIANQTLVKPMDVRS